MTCNFSRTPDPVSSGAVGHRCRKLGFGAFAVLLTLNSTHAQFVWVKQGGGESPRSISQGWDIAADSNGNFVAIGDTDDFGSDTIQFDTARGAGDAFVVKYSSDGRVLWLKTIDTEVTPTGGGWASGSGVAVDSSDNLIAVGSYGGRASFDGTSLVSSSSAAGVSHQNTFVAKYRPDGRIIWVKSIGGSNGAGGVAVDGRDNIIVAGSFSHTIDIDGTRFSVPDPADDPNAFIAKFDMRGNLLWAHHIVRILTEEMPFGLIQARDVAVDGDNSVLVTGRLLGRADFGGVTAASQINNDSMFVAKYTVDGALSWIKNARAPVPPPVNRPGSNGNAVAVDARDNVYVVGFHRLTTDFHGRVIGSELDPHDRMFVVKYSPAGAFQWVREPVTGAPISVICDRSQGYGLTTDSLSNIIVSGVASACNASPRDSGSGYEMLVGKYFPDGRRQWIRNTSRVGPTTTTNAGPYSYSVATDPNDNIALTGFFRTSFDGGPIHLTSRGRSDAFVAKMGTHADRCDTSGASSLSCELEPAWVHQHARCPYRRVDGECEGIFEDGLAPFESHETWLLDIADLSLHSPTDSDAFSFAIPDPQDAVYGAVHADIRPEDERIAEPADRIPLPECGHVDRQGIGLGGRTYTERVLINSAIIVQVIPEANAASVSAVNTDGESIRLYRGGTRADHIGSGSALMKRIDCPRSDPSEVANGKGLTEIEFSFGERSGSRATTAAGGYDVRVSYDITITRGGPAWIFDRARNIRFIPCFSPRGGFGPGPGPIPHLPIGPTPFCSTTPTFLPELELRHPRNIFEPDCIADGPGCMEFYSFAWPETNIAFDMRYTTITELDVELYDVDGVVIGRATPHQADNQQSQQSNVSERRLYVPQLAPGQYVLGFRGTSATYNVIFSPEMQNLSFEQVDQQKENLKK